MTRLLIIIPAGILTAVRAAAVEAFGDEAHGEFVEAGSPTGSLPATHWWLAGLFTDEQMLKIPVLHAAFPAAHVECYDLATQPGRPSVLLIETGLKPITPSVP